MKITSYENKITVYTYAIENTDAINDYIKKLILKLKKKYHLNIKGFYNINIYTNNKIGMIIDIVKDEDNFFYDLLDLKVKVYENSKVFFKFNDYFLNNKYDFIIFKDNYYIDIDNLNKQDILSMIEFCSLIYGEELNKINKELSCLTK